MLRQDTVKIIGYNDEQQLSFEQIADLIEEIM
jgi:hypothetical protein